MSYIYYKEALKDITKPCLFLDTNLFKENIQTILNASNGKKIRIASKSIRSLPILKDILNYSTTFQGVMCFTADETIYLKNIELNDILFPYPVWDTNHLIKEANQDSTGK